MKKKLIIICSCLVSLLCGCGEIEDIYIDGVLYQLDAGIDQDSDSTDAKSGTYVNGCYVGRCNLTNLDMLFKNGVNIPPARFGSFREEVSIWIDENVPEFDGDIFIDLEHIKEDGLDTIFYIKSDETETMVKVFYNLGEDTFTYEKINN